jgi:Tfp pilus assembly protein PilF
MIADALCERCGERLPSGESDCPYCSGRKRIPALHREPVLLGLVVVLAAGLWALTHYVTAAYETRQQQLAQQWYARGNAAMQAHQYAEAISDLSTALVYSHESSTVRLRLAEALAAGNHVLQAQAYLEALWAEQPGNATINLLLARIAAARGDTAGAQRYYYGAIYGVWDENPLQNRREARLELIRFLLRQGRTQQAQSELIAVSAELPREPALLEQVGGYFLEAGDSARALHAYATAIRLRPRDPMAIQGAAQAAYDNGQYALAERYAGEALALDPRDDAAAALRRRAERVLQLDPMQPRIGAAERVRRLAYAAAQAQSRLESCAAQRNVALTEPFGAPSPQNTLAGDYAQLLALKPRLTLRALRASPELADTALELVYRSELDTQQLCGPLTGDDAALLLIGQRNRGNQ